MSQPVQPRGLLANDKSSECLQLYGIDYNKSNIEARIRARRLSINNRELLLAIGENNCEKVAVLVNGEIDIHFKDRDGHTPLHWAVETQNYEIIKLLLRKEQDLMHERDKNLIGYAKSINRPDILQLLQNVSCTKLQEKGKKVNEGEFETKDIEEISSENTNGIERQETNKVLWNSSCSSKRQVENKTVKFETKEIEKIGSENTDEIECQETDKVSWNSLCSSKPQVKDKKVKFETKKIEKIDSENNNEIEPTKTNQVNNIRTDNIECIKTDEVLEHLDQVTGSIFETFQPDGVKKKASKKSKKNVTAIHGYIYQLKLLMLFLYRGVSQRYSFSLGTEIAEAKKFDDLVFEYVQDTKKVYRIFQVKHKQDESKKITAHSLLSEKNGDYNLVKYFLSYQKTKKEALFRSGLIKDVTICTNINWAYKDLENAGITLVRIKTEDNILILKGMTKEPQCYKLGNNVAALFKSKLKEYVTVQSAKELIQYTDDEIKDFLHRLVFAVNQPNEEELGKIVQNEMGKEFGFISTENVYNKVFVKLLKWLMDKKEDRFLSYKRGKEFFEEARTRIPLWFNVKNPAFAFVGRVNELKDLHKMLQCTNKNAVQIVCVCGVGGVGKSELVKQYINRYSEQYDNKVVWINAEIYKTLADSFYRLAGDKLGINTMNTFNKPKKMCSIVQDVYKMFADGKCLFIFDNAEKYKSQHEFDHGIESFLPSLPPNCTRPFILITSRNKKWPQDVQILQLDVFNEDDAKKLIRTSLCIKDDVQGDDIKEFVRELQYLPLAIQQGVAYIKSEVQKLQNIGLTFNVHDYLKRYKEKAEVLNFRFPECTDNDYTQTIFTTWDVTFDMINQQEYGNDALMILCIASYLAPEDIPIEIFCGVIDDKDKVASAVELLKQYSMVKIDHTVLNVHRLVQQVVRVKVEMQNREDVVLNSALRLFKNTVNSDNIDHAMFLCAYTKKHSRLLGGTCKLLKAISEEMLDNARLEEANLCNEQILELLDTLPESAKSVRHHRLGTINNMATIWMQEGKYDMALKTFLEISDSLKLLNMEDSAQYMTVQTNVAQVLYCQGEYNKALECYEQLYDWYANLKDCEHEFNIVKADMAAVLIKQGKFDKGLSMLQELCKDRERMLGAEDCLVMSTKDKIAVALMEQGRLDEALEVLETILSTEKDMQKKGRGIISGTKYHMGIILFLQGKYTKASEMLNEVLNVQELIRGKDHPAVLSTRCQLADVLTQQGKTEEAQAMCEDILNKQKRILASHHPEILRTLHIKASIFDIRHEYDSAIQIYQELLTGWRSKQCSDMQIASVLSSMGRTYANQRKYDKALEFAQEALSIQKCIFKENHINTLTTMNNIGLILYDSGEYNRALDIFNTIFNQLETANHHRMYDVKCNIASVFTALGKYDVAMKLSTEVYDVCKKNFKDSHQFCMKVMSNIVLCLCQQGRYVEAVDVFHDVYEQCCKHLGPESKEIAFIVHKMRQTLELMMVGNDTNGMQRFLDRTKSINLKHTDDLLLTEKAVNMKSADALKVLIKYGIDVTSDDLSKLLHKVAANGDLRIMGVLLRHISSNKLTDCVNAKAGISGDTPLHVAVKHGHLWIVEQLLTHGAFYNIRNSEGSTPLNLSSTPSITNLLELLVRLFQAAKTGDHQFISIMKQLNREQFEIVSGARNKLNCTLVQTLKVNRRMRLLQSYEKLALSLNIV